MRCGKGAGGKAVWTGGSAMYRTVNSRGKGGAGKGGGVNDTSPRDKKAVAIGQGKAG